MKLTDTVRRGKYSMEPSSLRQVGRRTQPPAGLWLKGCVKARLSRSPKEAEFSTYRLACLVDSPTLRTPAVQQPVRERVLLRRFRGATLPGLERVLISSGEMTWPPGSRFCPTPGQAHVESVDAENGGDQHADESDKPGALRRLQGEMPLRSVNTGSDAQLLPGIAGRLRTDGTRLVRLLG